MAPTVVWTRDQVAQRIQAGEHLLVYHAQLIRIPHAWLDAHPGGTIPILHFVGRDASDEIDAHHLDDTRTLIPRYAIGRVDVDSAPWLPLVPPIMLGWVRKPDAAGNYHWFNEANAVVSTQNTARAPSSQILLVEQHDSSAETGPSIAALQPPPTDLSPQKQARIAAAYRELHKRIVDAGLYQCRYITGYGPEVVRYVLLATISAYAYRNDWIMTSAVFLGLFWHQLVFTAHDLGHMGVTHNWSIDRFISIIIADFIGGLSIGWWVDNHNVHHLVTNHPSHDPDIEHLPFFAISPVFFSSLWSSYYKRTMYFDRFAKIFIAVQHRLFYIVMAFARFNLYANSYIFLYKKAFDTRRARGARWSWGLEIVGLIFFWTWFGQVLYGCGSWQKALAYLLISHAVTSPLHVQIVLSHFSMSTADLGPTESFPHRQMRTTTDVICPEPIGFIHGGLHLQVTHHLFPRLPRHNLKQASLLVKEFAKENGLTYAEFGFVSGNKQVIGVMRDVAEQVKLIGLVAGAEAKEAVDKKIAVASETWKKEQQK